MLKETIISNKAMCLLCGDVVESTGTHDFRSCSCGNLSVDGGHSYLRRCYAHGKESYRELSERIIEDDNGEMEQFLAECRKNRGKSRDKKLKDFL